MRTALLAAVLMLALVPAASADTYVTWTLDNSLFDDGATASGSFVYDATTNTFSSIDIATSLGTSFTGAAYNSVDPGFGPFAFDVAFVTSPSLSSYIGTPALELNFASNLTDAGGIVSTDINEFICSDANCSTATDIRGTVEGGFVSGVVNTPEPSSVALLLVGLVALCGVHRRRSRALTYSGSGWIST